MISTSVTWKMNNSLGQSDQKESSVSEKEYITFEEAVVATGFDLRHLRNLAKQAGITRVGRNAFMRDEFFAYWRFRSQESDKPRVPDENHRERMNRINHQWRAEFERTG